MTDGDSHASISKPFIGRPIATTLLMLGLLLAGIVAFPRAPRRRRSRRSTIRRLSSPRICRAPARTRWRRGHDAARAAVRADAVAHADDERLEPRHVADHAAVRRSIATSTPPSRTCRPRSTRRRALAADVARAADVLEEQSRRHADPHARASSPRRSRCNKVDDYADSILAQKVSQVSGVGLVTSNGRAETRRARASRSAGARRRRPHARRRARGDRRPRTSTSRRATSTGRASDFTIATNDQLTESRDVRSDRARVHKRRRRCGSKTSRRTSTASRTRSSPRGRRVRARCSSTCSASPARTSSRSPSA